jgi:hypothetical protein
MLKKLPKIYLEQMNAKNALNKKNNNKNINKKIIEVDVKNFSFGNLKNSIGNKIKEINKISNELKIFYTNLNKGFEDIRYINNQFEDIKIEENFDSKMNNFSNNFDYYYLIKEEINEKLRKIKNFLNLNDNGIPNFDFIKKSQEYFNSKNLNSYRDFEKNNKINFLNFDLNREINEDGNCFYFGETEIKNKSEEINGFGFFCDKKESEIYLGNFSDDKFLNGIYIKNQSEIFIGEFYYKDFENKNTKTNFTGVIFDIQKNQENEKNNYNHNYYDIDSDSDIDYKDDQNKKNVKLKNKDNKKNNNINNKKFQLNILSGKFDFIMSEFDGISIKETFTNEILIDLGVIKESKKNSDKFLSLKIPSDKEIEDNYKKINKDKENCKKNNNNNNKNNEDYYTFGMKLIIADYKDDIIINEKYLVIDENSMIKVSNINNNNSDKSFFCEIFYSKINNCYYRGTFDYDQENGIKPIKGNLLDINKRFQYIGEFKFGKLDGHKGKYKLFLKENKSGFKSFQFVGKFENNNFIQGYMLRDKIKFLDFAIFLEGFDLRYGVVYYGNNQYYKGQFLNSLRDGKGYYQYDSNKYYKGEWKKGNRHGLGKLRFIDEEVYIKGQYINNRLNKNIFDTSIEDSDYLSSFSNKPSFYDYYDDEYKNIKKNINYENRNINEMVDSYMEKMKCFDLDKHNLEIVQLEYEKLMRENTCDFHHPNKLKSLKRKIEDKKIKNQYYLKKGNNSFDSFLLTSEDENENENESKLDFNCNNYIDIDNDKLNQSQLDRELENKIKELDKFVKLNKVDRIRKKNNN